MAIVIVSCQPIDSIPSQTTSLSAATPRGEITELAGLVIGRLELIGGCPSVTSVTADGGGGTALVWAPHIKVKIEPDNILVTSFNKTEDYYYGEMVSLGGGELGPDGDSLLKTLPASCKGPYWLVSHIEPLSKDTMERFHIPTGIVTPVP